MRSRRPAACTPDQRAPRGAGVQATTTHAATLGADFDANRYAAFRDAFVAARPPRKTPRPLQRSGRFDAGKNNG